MKKVTSCTFCSFHYVSAPQLSPSAEQVAFIVKRVDRARNRYDSDLYLHKKGMVRRLTLFGCLFGLLWLDEDTILFSSAYGQKEQNRGEQTTFYRLKISSGEIERAFAVPLHSARLIYGEELQVIVLGRHNNVRQTQKDGGAVTTLTEIPYWGEFGLGYTSGTRERLYLFDIRTQKLEPITSPWFEVVKVQYSDGKLAIIGMEYHVKAVRKCSLSVYDIRQKELTLLVPQGEMHIFSAIPFADEILFTGNTSMPSQLDRDNNNFYRISAIGGKYSLG